VGRSVGRSAPCGACVRLNQVWILADDLNYDLVRTTRGKMPNLQKRMITKGLEFSNHVAIAPVCGPSRSSLLAGRFIHNVG
jgi:N-acetylglucosamine-6-sulfatase